MGVIVYGFSERGMKMRKVWSNEGELVVVLKDVDEGLNNDEFYELMSSYGLGEVMESIIGDMVSEGDFVGDDEDIEGIEIVEMSMYEYMKGLKNFCRENYDLKY